MCKRLKKFMGRVQRPTQCNDLLSTYAHRLHYAPINIMPHYSPYGTRWGFVILASTKDPPLGATLADKSPLIPCIGGGVVVGVSGGWRRMVQYETLLHRNSRSFAYEMHHYKSLIMCSNAEIINKTVSITYKLLFFVSSMNTLS